MAPICPPCNCLPPIDYVPTVVANSTEHAAEDAPDNKFETNFPQPGDTVTNEDRAEIRGRRSRRLKFLSEFVGYVMRKRMATE